MKKPHALLGTGAFVLASLVLVSAQNAPARLSPMEELGKRLFFDRNLSSPAGQECAACHGSAVGFTGPSEHLNKTDGVYEGAVKGRFGNRKPPAAAYAGDSPNLHLAESGEFVGGLFWDGRATGDVLGDPLAEQAMGPFLNPLEQNMPDAKSVVLAVKRSSYAGLFEKVFGPGSLAADKDPEGTYAKIGRAIAAYERSAEVNPFSSKFDDFWRAASGKGLEVETIGESNLKDFRDLGLAENELRGLVLFNAKGLCANCHVLAPVNGKPPIFADYKYDNLGIPRNTTNPFYGQDKIYNPDGKNWVDRGLGGFLETVEKYKQYAAANYGRHRAPTLRNVDKRPSPGFAKAFMHNGYFKSLKDIVHFYNTRDVAGAGWPPPEVAANVNKTEMGNLGLTGDEEDAIVDFMKTLTDRR
ncbi:MAG TPA: cytochrome c peroxidase [Candidatus Latescibacteria bacterium]|nr:cytochrome c peroxidase [Candidatus Latescibacterota bacterium]